MNRTCKAAVAALMLAVGFAGSVSAGPYEDVAAAMAAYSKGDYVTALRLLRPRAEQGYPEAQYNLGAMYELGQGVLQDHTAAMSLARKAAQQGHVMAQIHLAHMYYTGWRETQDYAAAMSWYRKAADQGNADAQ